MGPSNPADHTRAEQAAVVQTQHGRQIYTASIAVWLHSRTQQHPSVIPHLHCVAVEAGSGTLALQQLLTGPSLLFDEHLQKA